MAETTGIPWCDATFNAWEGCVKISPGCDGCYAAARDERLHHGENWGMDAARYPHTDAYWKQPLKWDKEAFHAGVRKRVFCGSLMDIMEDRRDLDQHRARVFDLIRHTSCLDWLLVTKRPMNFRRLLPKEWLKSMPQNVWGITTVESQDYTWRIDELLKIPFAIHGVSYEPALGYVDFSPWLARGLNWVIVGGESDQRGHVAREFRLAWARRTVLDCDKYLRAVFVKQLGSAPASSIPLELVTITHKKGEAIEEWPRDLQIRQFPRGDKWGMPV